MQIRLRPKEQGDSLKIIFHIRIVNQDHQVIGGILTLCQHAHFLALSEATLLALSPHVHVHFTVPPTLAFVHSILGYTPPEETWSENRTQP